VPFVVGDVVAGRYEVQDTLGHSPLGVLYRAREREIGVDVTLRVIGGNVLPDEAARTAFAQRMGRARAFSHPNLVRVFGIYPTADEVVIAVQWAPGQTLAESAAHQPFTVEEARPLIAQVAAAMTHAHQHGVVLGDVQADGCVLMGQVLKVANVGIGPALPRKLFLEAAREAANFGRLPPELRNGATVDSRADVYSLAMVLVEMLTGGGDVKAVPSPSRALATVLQRALADDPLIRHASIDALAQELEAALSGQPLKARRPTPPIGTPLYPGSAERSERHRVSALPRLDDSTAQVPRPDDVRPPSQETTRTIDEEELALLKGDQITRQVPLEELFPLRLASSETQPFERQQLLEEQGDDVAARNYDELTLDRRPEPSPPDVKLSPHAKRSPETRRAGAPPGRDDDMATDQVLLLEPDSAKTVQVPRLIDNNSPPPLDDELILHDEVDTRRVKKLSPSDDNLTPLPPPSPPSPNLTPLPPPGYSSPAKPAKIEIEASRPVLDREPTIEVTELPFEVQGPASQPPLPPPAVAATSLPPPAPPPPLAPAEMSPSLKLESPPPRVSAFATPDETDDDLSADHVDTNEVPPRQSEPRKRRNPFDPTVTADAVQALPPPEALQTMDGKGRRARTKTMEVTSLDLRKRSSLPTIALVAIVAFAAAVGVALAISQWMGQQRLEQERRDKQKLADSLNAEAQSQARDPGHASLAAAGAARATSPKMHASPLDTVLPRAGACPLGAKLVAAPKPFCIDAYEYPGGNTIPRTTVSFPEASHICAARGERLCGESEWEHACRGKNGASFPYGDTFDPARCNTRSTTSDIAPSGKFASCKSASGVYDMIGNVAEWTASGAQKGGSVRQLPKETRCSSVVRNAGKEGGTFVGFRCCADPVPVAKH
jgi:serine/threonine protein kinase